MALPHVPGPDAAANGGFTLIELMVVVALLAIVTAVAAPSMASFISAQRVKAVSNDLGSDLMLARSEALKRSASVSITPRTGGWSAGWVVAAGATTLVTREAVSETLNLVGAPSGVTFNMHGRVSAPSGAVRMTLASAATAGDNAKRCIELDLAGRVQTRVGACP